MEFINSILNWMGSHWIELGAALALIREGGKGLAKITPWEWDDSLVEFLDKLIRSLFPKKK